MEKGAERKVLVLKCFVGIAELISSRKYLLVSFLIAVPMSKTIQSLIEGASSLAFSSSGLTHFELRAKNKNKKNKD